ncbi:unnamed protein product [Medioppia subpectinata]|uniref:Methionine synthase reductase n=1 Tax=Medioppia subpectinata TaxID=1979941 RepID=A0A7R9KXN3_9ACAR|nr:unnamed protein product [Medioppia subpectinata]CAG2111764.1 unnamed protein product [Medioppia subpectinata]
MTRRVVILYGSETGQAEAISHQIYDQCWHQLEALIDNLNVKIDRFCLDQTGDHFTLESEEAVIFVVSTTGEGEPPANALKFYRKYRKRALDRQLLSAVSYTLLALGDTNYERFANFGKDLDKRLQELSAKQFYETGFGDDAVGLELGVEPWIENLFPAILQHFKAYSALSVPIVDTKTLSPIQLQMAVKDNCGELMHTTDQRLALLDQLTLPLISSKFQSFRLQIHETLPEECDANEFYFQTLPVMDSKIFDTNLVHLRQLSANTSADDNPITTADCKTIIEATIEAEEGSGLSYESGDSYGFIVGNCDEEVHQVLDALNLSDKCDYYCEVLTPQVFPHLPKICKVNDLIKYYVEIRSVPKKSTLRHLADFCDNPSHKRRLLELSSREGGDDYNRYVRNKFVNILDILQVFDSCRPPLEVVLANSPCFAPRYYSVCNAPDAQNRNAFKIAFSVMNFENTYLREDTQLFGVFTGTLFRQLRPETPSTENNVEQYTQLFGVFTGTLFRQLRPETPSTENNVEQCLDKLSLESNVKSFKVFKRKNPYFKLPSNLTTPLIMVGAGTGVAPYVGFLQQRQLMARRSSVPAGECWLFYGCRHSRVDYIFADELQQFRTDRVLTQLNVCFSRECPVDDPTAPKYVQHLIAKHSSPVFKLIDSRKAVVYVCGDLKGMSTDVFNAMVAVVETSGKRSREDAVKYIRELQSEKRYLQDIWT